MSGDYDDRPSLGEQDRLLEEDSPTDTLHPSHTTKSIRRWPVAVITTLLTISVVAGLWLLTVPRNVIRHPKACNTLHGGYNCFASISHRWGQYSPYFSLASESISGVVPEECHVTFVQVLSRHGARYPTATKSNEYMALVAAIQANATRLEGKYAFLRNYTYTLGSDDLTTFGEGQMINSGIKFYQRYESLARDHVPFIRASGSARVIDSAKKFIQGFEQTKRQSQNPARDRGSPEINVIISEDIGSNNTLNHNTCPNFEASVVGSDVAEHYAAIFVPPIRKRLEHNLPGVQLSNIDVVYLMDLCAFETVASTKNASKESAFCNLFTEDEWAEYNYLQSLAKYYGYGAGNPLGPTQGLGFVNELIARLTKTPVLDDTTINRTLDAPGVSTFPINRTIYADFTHDNGMIPIFFALGLYNGTAVLPRNHIQTASAANGFSAAWTVPFGARAYIEMMQCSSDPDPEPFVRVLVNDRVVPLHGCNVDSLGRCRRKEFINGLSFARSGGKWASCYSESSMAEA